LPLPASMSKCCAISLPAKLHSTCQRRRARRVNGWPAHRQIVWLRVIRTFGRATGNAGFWSAPAGR
jgi:hypothetical protein